MQKILFIFLLLLIVVPAIVLAQGFQRNLYFGMQNNPDVIKMQDFLRGLGYFNYPVSTGNYFTVTMQAVKKFQQAQGIQPVGGYFGPQSRAAANRILQSAAVPSATGQTYGGQTGGTATTSSYKDKIYIAYVTAYSSDPNSQSITIGNRSQKESISLTGWSVVNSQNNAFIIPQGYELPGFSAIPQNPIVLRPGGRATVSVGTQDRRMDFQENLCTGYFDETSNFNPSLSHSCPRPDTSQLLNLKDSCLKVIDAAQTCRTSNTSQFIDSNCSQYLSDNLSYAGCVRNYRDRPDFYSNNWLIWMQKTDTFFRVPHDTIILKDNLGREVDTRTY